MGLITISGLGWTAAGRRVLDDLHISFGRERTGLVGRNGVGKSLLLSIIAGDQRPSTGTVHIVGKVALMRQTVRDRPDDRVVDLFGATEALAILSRAEIGEATTEELADADWTLPDSIAAALNRVGLAIDADTPLDVLSGGQRGRARLAAAVFTEPDFLLLDEPTNDLDREGRKAVAQLVESWPKGMIVASHDRELLERVDSIVELGTLGATRYGGGWSSYRERRAVALEAARRDLANAEKRVAEVVRKGQLAHEQRERRDARGSRTAARGGMPNILAGRRANTAQTSSGSEKRVAARLTDAAVEAVTTAQAQVEVLQQLSVSIPSTRLLAGRAVLELKDVACGHGPGVPVFRNVNLNITGPERLAVTGPNGSSKSTLLRLAAGDLTPLEGTVLHGSSAVLLDQHVAFLDRDASVLENFRRLNPGMGDNACHASLAGFLFRADAALRLVGTLSGGQTLLAGLACQLGGAVPPTFLVLDEPTNRRTTSTSMRFTRSKRRCAPMTALSWSQATTTPSLRISGSSVGSIWLRSTTRHD